MSVLGLVLRNIKITWSTCYKCRFPGPTSCLLKQPLMVGPRWFFDAPEFPSSPKKGPEWTLVPELLMAGMGFSAGGGDPKTILLQNKNVTNQGGDALSVVPAPALALPENLLEMQTSMSCPRTIQSQKHWSWASIWLNEILRDSDACWSARISAHYCKGLSALRSPRLWTQFLTFSSSRVALRSHLFHLLPTLFCDHFPFPEGTSL